MDKKVVPFIDTICNPSNLTTVKRKKKDGSTVNVSCPLSVQLYNKYMGGVDMADQLRKAYSCRRRSRKWWLPLFYFMVDISMVNSYILHCDTPQASKLTIKEFILELATELMSCDSIRKRPAGVLPQPSLDAPPSARGIFHCSVKTSASAEYAAKMASKEEWCTAAWIAIPRGLFSCAQSPASASSTLSVTLPVYYLPFLS